MRRIFSRGSDETTRSDDRAVPRRTVPEQAPSLPPRKPGSRETIRFLRPSEWGATLERYVQRRQKEKEDLDVYRQLSEGARSTAEYYVLILLSCLIATTGLIQGSPAVIIGAMIIAPLMTPILSFSLGVIWGDMRLLGTAFFSILSGTILAVAFSALIALLVPLSHLSAEILSRTKPTLFDLIVALGSGALAAFGSANKKVINALTGIAIAVALMPPLCVIGIGIGKLDLEVARGASLLFATNLVAISLAAAVVFWLMKIHPLSEDVAEVKRRAIRQIFFSVVLLAGIAFPVALSMESGYRAEHSRLLARELIARAIPTSSILSIESTAGAQGPVLRVTIASGIDPDTAAMEALAKEIVRAGSYYKRAEIVALKANRFVSD